MPINGCVCVYVCVVLGTELKALALNYIPNLFNYYYFLILR